MSYSEWIKGRETGYIDRAKLLNEMEHECENCEFRDSDGYECEECDYAHAMLYVKAQKAIKMQPVKRGEWTGDDIKSCSICGNEAYWDTDYGQQLFDYCPYCGADMRGDTNG